MPSLARRALAGGLSATLILLSAGPGCHEALASRYVPRPGVPAGPSLRLPAGLAVIGVPTAILEGFAGPRDGSPTLFVPRGP